MHGSRCHKNVVDEYVKRQRYVQSSRSGYWAVGKVEKEKLNN